MIYMTIIMTVRPEKSEELRQVMHSLRDGGVRCSAWYRDIDGAIAYRLIFEWNDKEELDRYAGTERFRGLLGAIKGLCEKSGISCGTFRRMADPRTDRCQPPACDSPHPVAV
jgi:quinol monooxygenase YgiN